MIDDFMQRCGNMSPDKATWCAATSPEPEAQEADVEDDESFALEADCGPERAAAAKEMGAAAVAERAAALLKADIVRPGIVHRLDKGTTGVMVSCSPFGTTPVQVLVRVWLRWRVLVLVRVLA